MIDFEVTFSLSFSCEIAKLEPKQTTKKIKPQHQSPLGGKEKWGLCDPLILLLWLQ